MTISRRSASVALVILAALLPPGISLVYLRIELGGWVEEIKQELRFSQGSGQWDLTRFDQHEGYDARHYYLFDFRKGKINRILAEKGFVPELELRVDPSTELEGQGFQTRKVPETVDTWRLFIKPVANGNVILGSSSRFPLDDKQLEEDAEKFGESIDAASRIQPEQVASDYAVIDGAERLRAAAGGIPLRVRPDRPDGRVCFRMLWMNRTAYVFLSEPFPDSQGRTVGLIWVFDAISRALIIAIATSSVLCALTPALIGAARRRGFRPERLLDEALQEGEGERVEFKPALRWDPATSPNQNPTELRKVEEGKAVRSIAAFLNAKGGALFIGIADDKDVVGLEGDYKSRTQPRGSPDQDKDWFERHLRQVLSSEIGTNISDQYVQVAIVKKKGKDVCVVRARPGASPVYLTGGRFYRRTGPYNEPLDLPNAVKYIRRRFGIRQRLLNFLRG